MDRRTNRNARSRRRPGGWSAADERRELRRFLGGLVAIAAVMVLMPTGRVFYRWIERARYSIVDVEVLSPSGSARTPRTVRVRELATGSELWVEPQAFDELMSEGPVSRSIAAPGMRFSAWFNPAAHASAGILLFDQRLVSRARYPYLATGASVAGHAGVLFGLTAIAAGLIATPSRSRRRRRPVPG